MSKQLILRFGQMLPVCQMSHRRGMNYEDACEIQVTSKDYNAVFLHTQL